MMGWWRRRKQWNEAARWYARMAEPQSSAEIDAFERWLAQDPANAKAYSEMDAIAGVAAASGGWSSAPAGSGRETRRRSPVVRPALAFVLAVAAVTTGLMLTQGPAAPAFAAVVNEGVAVRGVRLADGTAVWLDVGARIAVRLGDKRREIEVRAGRVRIEPAVESRPILVTARGTEISAKGGRFDVTLLPNGVALSTLVGDLTVFPVGDSHDGRGMRMPSGKAFVMDNRGVRPATQDRTWPAGRLRFEAVPLDRIVALANRQGAPVLLIDTQDTAGLRVSGVFDLRDTRRLARKLAATLDLEVRDTPNGLLLHRSTDGRKSPTGLAPP